MIFLEDDKDLYSLKKALKKNNGRVYVIDMSRYDQYNEKNDISSMSSNGVISLLEDNDLSSIINVLYQIRCNIFHGGKEPGDHHDDEIVNAANPILNRIVEFIIYEDPNERLHRIKNIIEHRYQIPRSQVLWGGAYLIITYNNYTQYPKGHNERYPDDVVIRTDLCKELSWLIFELQKIYQDRLGRIFYEPLGKTIKKSLKENKDIYSVFSDALIKCEELIKEQNI